MLICTALLAVLALAQGSRAAEIVQVTCGSTLKLLNDGTKSRLHSHDIAYSSGSQQHSVTGYTGNDSGDLWTVWGPHDSPCVQGSVLKSGSVVRLQHVNSRHWLHSHDFPSPLSNSREVSAYGSDTQSDVGDLWRLELSKGASTWVRDEKVKLQHRDTKGWLACSGKQYGRPIQGQFEVVGADKSASSNWLATEGVYMPVASA